MLHTRAVPLRKVFAVFLLLTLLSALSHQSGFDRWLAHRLYAFEGGNGHPFPWRDNYWLYTVLHEGGRALVKRLFFLDVALFLGSWLIAGLRRYRQVFCYIAISTLLATALISSLKHLTRIPCPQALVEFGGHRAWIDYWQLFSPQLPKGSCYPAGHASGGYAWLCLAFVFPFASRRFFVWLTPGLLLGLVFGVAQQLRGAHFISHDLMTVALCWLVSALVLAAIQAIQRALRTLMYPLELAYASEQHYSR